MLFLATAGPAKVPAARGPAAAEPVPAQEYGEPDPDGADDPEEAGATEGADPEAEAPAAAGAPGPGVRYTADLPDAMLAQQWEHELEALGSISVGIANAGRLINGVRFPQDGPWLVTAPELAYGTREVVASVAAAIREVSDRFPGTTLIRVNHLSGPEGGHLRPHRSHQTGRDVDLSFYYRTPGPVGAAEREKLLDVERCWALVRALVTHGDVQLILVDRRIIKILETHARGIGEDPAWLDSIFDSGSSSLLQHARRHRDHFHVRYFDGRAQELGRRVLPLLSRRPEQNVISHRVRAGDTLGHLALRYNSTQELIRRANALRGSFLRAGRTISVPLRGPCTRCPVPPEVVVPPRRLPPDLALAVAPVPAQQPRAPSAPVASPGATSAAAFRPAAAERCSRAR